MEEKDERKRQLAELLHHSAAITLDGSDQSVEALDHWFRDNVQGDPDNPDRLMPWWHAVVRDIGLWLGDLLIERHPHLQWRLFTWGKKNHAYQRPVIMGFNVPEKKYNADFEHMVFVYALVVLDGEDTELHSNLLELLHDLGAKAEGQL